MYDKIAKAPTGLTRPSEDVLTSIFAVRDFFNGDLNISTRWLSADSGASGVISPKIKWSLDDSTELSIGADLFYGDREDIFGQFEDADRVTFAVPPDFLDIGFDCLQDYY